MTSPHPKDLGYRMPAEWEPHEATWLSWPHNPETWPGHVGEIEKLYTEIVFHLVKGEKVHVLVNGEDDEARVRKLLKDQGIAAGCVRFFQFPTDDAWLRDNGPNFLVRDPSHGRALALNEWIFDSWGKKYPPWLQDSLVPGKVASLLGLPSFEPKLVLEGGSIDTDGCGTVLTTEQCLLQSGRNPGCDKACMEQALENFLGVDQVIWLGRGIAGDDTDGHVDDMVRFVAPGRVVCARETDVHDSNYGILEENFNRLSGAKDSHGKPLEVIGLPMPGCVEGPEGRLPASYANFYIANQVVLVPIFHHSHDDRALAILREIFPEKEIIGLDCRLLVLGLGSLHCITQQQPSTARGGDKARGRQGEREAV